METGAAIREFTNNKPIYHKVGKVTKVDDTTCEALLVEDENITYTEVRLKAHLQGDKSIIIKPAVGSFVLLGFLSSTDVFVSMFDQVDSVSIKMFNHTILLDQTGFSVDAGIGKIALKNDTEDLKKILEDLITAIKQITVTTSLGESKPPSNLLQFDMLAKRIPLLLK